MAVLMKRHRHRASMARAALVRTPPENTPRRIRVFTRIDADEMEEDYWEALEAYRERGSLRDVSAGDP